MNNYCVYCHTNKINEKKYIGITSQKPERRWNNGEGYRNNEYFYRAIKKYGWHNFMHEILYTNLSRDEAEKLEVNLIAEYETRFNNKGYNIESGGNTKKDIPLETRKKISERLKGHECSDETKRKISLSKRGKPSPNKGRKMSEEFIEKNRLSHIGQKAWNKGKRWTDEEKAKFGGKAVMCIENGKIYRSAHEAGRDLNVNFSSIRKCVKGKTKTAGGYHWISAEEWSLPNE